MVLEVICDPIEAEIECSVLLIIGACEAAALDLADLDLGGGLGWSSRDDGGSTSLGRSPCA